VEGHEETPLRETWTTRELPVLRAALARLDRGETVELDDVREEVGLSAAEIGAAVDALGNATPPYIDVTLRNGWDGVRSPGWIDGVHERARRELGTWPSADGLISELAAALSHAADSEKEPEKKSRLRAAADALADFGRDVAVAVAARHLGG
jgi:hypothetical protein